MEQRQPRWPAGEGEMARRIRSNAWEQTPLGALEMWSERLRAAVELMLESAFPSWIWWGAERLQLYNDAAVAIHRLDHPQVFARPAHECWGEFANTLGALADHAMSGAGPAFAEDLLLITDQRRSPDEGNWFTVSASPLRTADGDVMGAFITIIETTRRILAETRVRASEVRAKTLFQQAPGIVLVFRGPDHVVEFTNDVANRLIGGRELPGRSAREISPRFGGSEFLALLDHAYTSGQRVEGNAVSVPLRSSSSLPGERIYLDFAVVPITDSSGLVTGTFVMGFDVTDRIRAQRILNENAGRQACLLRLSDALRPLVDPHEIEDAAARVVGEHLNVSRAFYGDIERGADGSACFVVNRDYHAAGVSSTVGRFPAGQFGDLVQDVVEGRSIAICDVTDELGLSDEERAAYLKIGAQAWCAVPLIKQGVAVAYFAVHQVTAREWEDHEMALLEETAERVWVAIEYGRAEMALRESEKRLQVAQTRLASALEAGLAGTFYWDVEHDLVVTDESLRRYFSLPPRALTDGVPLEEVLPAICDEDRPGVRQALADAIERTGVYSVEYRVQHQDGRTRWLSARGRVERNSAGSVVALPGFAVDITRIKENAGARC